MPLHDNTHYVTSVGWSAVTAWAALTAYAAGDLRRQDAAPAVGSERVFVCIVAGTSLASEPTWTVTRGAKTAEAAGPTWQECTGLAGVNGDITNTPSWAEFKAVTSTGVLGQLIKNNAGTHLFIMSTAGTIGASQPTFDTTAGNTTVDNGATWTCIGAVGAFTGGQAPHARIPNALATNWAGAGDYVFVENSHAETSSAAVALGGAGTVAAPVMVICHDGGAYPPVAANVSTGATITATGVATGLSAVTAVGLYVEGVRLIHTANGGSITLGVANGGYVYWKNCIAEFTGSNATMSMTVGATSQQPAGKSVLENVDFIFSSASQTGLFLIMGEIEWRGGSIAGTIPTTLIKGSGTSQVRMLMHGIDLSAVGSGKTLFSPAGAHGGVIDMVNCKLNNAVTVASAPTTENWRLNVVNCDSGDVNYRNEVYAYSGTMTTETTIVRTGGASDGDTPVSWKLVTTANALFIRPFEFPPIPVWNRAVGSPKTLTIQGIWGGAAVPDNDDIWVEVEYLGDANSPVSSFVSDAKATVLTTAAAQDAGSGTWSGSVGSNTKFALAVTFTPEQEGFVTARVKCGLPSSTLYVDPKPVIT